MDEKMKKQLWQIRGHSRKVYQELINRPFLLADEADQLEQAAKRLGIQLRWQHRPLYGPGMAEWRDGRHGD